jgi:PAS domain S-box-containing protein
VATSDPTPTRKAPEPTTVDSGREVLLHELAALRRSEAVLRDFIETSTIGLHWLGADGTILWANQAELDLLGYAREEYVGRNITEFHADESVVNDMLGRLSRGETLRDYPARLRHRDGSIRHVLVNSSVLFEDGKFVHTRCFTRDVTALKQEQEANLLAGAAMRESEERFRRVFEEGPLGLALLGKDKRFLKINSALCQMLGYAETELVQKSFAEITHPDDVRADVELTERLFSREIPFYRLQKRFYCEIRRRAERRWIRLTECDVTRRCRITQR